MPQRRWGWCLLQRSHWRHCQQWTSYPACTSEMQIQMDRPRQSKWPEKSETSPIPCKKIQNLAVHVLLQWRRLICVLGGGFSSASPPYKGHIYGKLQHSVGADLSSKLRDLWITSTQFVWIQAVQCGPFILFFQVSFLATNATAEGENFFFEPWPINMMVLHIINSYYSPKRVLHEQSFHLQGGLSSLPSSAFFFLPNKNVTQNRVLVTCNENQKEK